MNQDAATSPHERGMRLVVASSPTGSLWLVLLAAVAGSAWTAWRAPPAFDPLGSAAWLDPAAAPVESFRLLPGIGPRLAERIDRMRGDGIDFDSVEDLRQVPGIGPRRIEAIRPFVRGRAGSAGAGSSGDARLAIDLAPADTTP